MKTTKAMREELRKDFVHGDFNALSEDGSIGPALLDDIEMLHEKLIRYINDRGKSSSKINSLESEVARLRGLLERTKYAIEDAVFRISKGAPQDLERLAILCADLEKGAG